MRNYHSLATQNCPLFREKAGRAYSFRQNFVLLVADADLG